MKIPHSSLPWKVDDVVAYGFDLLDAHGKWIGSIHTSHDRSVGFPTDEEGNANKDFIVKAVNCHEELLRAALEAIEAWEFTSKHLNYAGPTPVWVKEIKLIAKAEGKS